MCEELVLERVDNSSWGFRLTGGMDFGTPLTVIKVTGGSISELCGVEVGDLIVEINGKLAKHFTHTDAEQCITVGGDRLTLKVMRGSELTLPVQTPIHEMIPGTETEGSITGRSLTEEFVEQCLEYENVSSKELESIMSKDSLCGETEVEISASLDQILEEVSIKTEDVTELQLDELLTGNEEVLEEGIIGINFQKFHPQVDFIRKSEVFKALQTENTHKEIPEEIQLEIEPTKRFSTFLMKPKPPPSPKPTGPYWHYPKAPNYLPKEAPKEAEQPKRREIKEKAHSVLWIFLEDVTGDEVVGERWGTPEEEMINLSRNENREEDEWSSKEHQKNVENSKKVDGHEKENVEVTGEIQKANLDTTTKQQGESEKIEHREVSKTSEILHDESIVTHQEKEYHEQTVCKEKLECNADEIHTVVGCENENDLLGKKLEEIKTQLAVLEGNASNDLQMQLMAIHKQLIKIVEEHSSTTIIKESEECLSVNENERIESGFVEESENISCEETRGSNSDEVEELYFGQDDEGTEEEMRDDTDGEKKESNDDDFEVLGQGEILVERYKEGEFELLEAPAPVKKSKHPLTPQARPIVLPGGRMWRQPKDAALEEYYQGVLVEQADVLVGSNDGINFRKYVPPKFDVDSSPVCRLIHEIEEKTKNGKLSPELKYYQTPISKRHFYAAALPAPEPRGKIELSEIESDL